MKFELITRGPSDQPSVGDRWRPCRFSIDRSRLSLPFPGLRIVALLTLVGLLHLTCELVQFLNQLIEIGFEYRQVARLRLFHRETLI